MMWRIFLPGNLLTNVSYRVSGAGLGRQRRKWIQRPLCEDNLETGQETQAGDKDQEENSQPEMEWNFLLWRSVSFQRQKTKPSRPQISDSDLNRKFKLDFALRHKLVQFLLTSTHDFWAKWIISVLKMSGVWSGENCRNHSDWFQISKYYEENMIAIFLPSVNNLYSLIHCTV